MKLYQFLAEQQDELIALCAQIIKRDVPEHRDEVVGDHLESFLGEVIRTLRRRDGAPDDGRPSEEICPGDVARDRRRRGFRAEHLVPTYAALSVAMGELAGRQHLAFAADEYGAFNQTIDKHLAEAIEAFTEDLRQEQDQVLGKHLGFLAHELRNALASAKMAFRMLEQGHVGIHGHTANVIRRNHARMDTLIDQTLLAARTRSGVVKTGLHEVMLVPLLREIESSTVLERNIGMRIDADASLRVIADENLLVSAISNLVQNAVKFSHEGATVVLSARSDGDTVVIEVEDECGGLPEERQEGLFEPFQQGTRDRRGAGLGLAITREAVQALAGEIRVRDIPGKGCVFTVRLRAAGMCGETLAS